MKVKFQIMAIAGLFACYFMASSCGGNVPTIPINVESMVVELNDILVGSPAGIIAKGGGDEEPPLNTFSESRTISLESLKGITADEMADILKYQEQIVSAKAGSITIAITSTDEEAMIVRDFLLEADGFTNNIYVEQYDLGTPITPETADFTAFANELLMKLVMSSFTGLNEVTFNISGLTDVISGESLNVTITLGDVVFEAKVGEITNPIEPIE